MEQWKNMVIHLLFLKDIGRHYERVALHGAAGTTLWSLLVQRAKPGS
jgi:hypothetical protein